MDTLRKDVAEGLLTSVEHFSEVANIYSKIELDYFFRTLYAAVKGSAEFTKALLSVGWTKSLKEANKLYSAAIELYAVKKYGTLLKEDVELGEDCTFSTKDPLPVFQVSLSYWLMYQNNEQRTPQRLQTTLRRVGQLLIVEDDRLEEGIKEL